MRYYQLPSLLAFSMLCIALPSYTSAQDAEEKPEKSTASEKPEDTSKKEDPSKEKGGEKKKAEEKKKEEGDQPAKPDTALEPAEPTQPDPEPAQPEPTPDPTMEEQPSIEGLGEEEPGDGGIGDLGGMGEDEEFVPLEDIDEETLIFPAKLYPFIDWHGHFRTRQIMASGFDLGTRGTSSILPPAESYTPNGNPANPGAGRLWSTDFRLRVQPKITIVEGLSLQVEADLLGNQVFGSLPIQSLTQSSIRPDPSRNQASSGQISQREREWYSNAVQINEAYGEIRGFFGAIRAGRMDNDWGLGMFYNGGDCFDCNFGDHIDRLQFESAFQGLYGAFSFDFPGEGLTTNTPASPQQQALDASQTDDIDQYTLTFEFKPKTQTEIALQQKALVEDRDVVLNGGLLFSWRDQEGAFTDPYSNPENAASRGGQLVYRGLDMYVVDGWGRMLWQPNDQTSVRVDLEVMGIFGSIDNKTFDTVGENRNSEGAQNDFNCFDEDVRSQQGTGCTENSKTFSQLAVALETEFSFNRPIAFGLNAGLASGGNTPNWAWSQQSINNGDDLDFFRFDPDYHVDLILFRQVIGTVTNAYYFNPYIQASFLESDGQKLRFDADIIVSRAYDPEGTPSGDNAWLGTELDVALRFIQQDTFHAAFEAGLLFPLSGLNAVTGRPRLTQFGGLGPTFTENVETSTAWTLQFKLDWAF